MGIFFCTLIHVTYHVCSSIFLSSLNTHIFDPHNTFADLNLPPQACLHSPSSPLITSSSTPTGLALVHTLLTSHNPVFTHSLPPSHQHAIINILPLPTIHIYTYYTHNKKK